MLIVNELGYEARLEVALETVQGGTIFTALQVMQTRYSDEFSVRLRVIPDKTEERSVQIFTLYERTFSLVF